MPSELQALLLLPHLVLTTVVHATPLLFSLPEIVHIVLWRLKKPGLLTSTSTEDALAQAKRAIGALKQVPGPEVMHLGPPMIDARAKGFDYGELQKRPREKRRSGCFRGERRLQR